MIPEQVKFRSLSTKLLAIYVPLVCVTAFFLFALLEMENYQSQRVDLVNEINELAKVQNSSFVEALWELDTEQIQSMLEELKSLDYVRGAVVYDLVGEVQGLVGDVVSEPEAPEFRGRTTSEPQIFEQPGNPGCSRGNRPYRTSLGSHRHQVLDRWPGLGGLGPYIGVWHLERNTRHHRCPARQVARLHGAGNQGKRSRAGAMG